MNRERPVVPRVIGVAREPCSVEVMVIIRVRIGVRPIEVVPSLAQPRRGRQARWRTMSSGVTILAIGYMTVHLSSRPSIGG